MHPNFSSCNVIYTGMPFPGLVEPPAEKYGGALINLKLFKH